MLKMREEVAMPVIYDLYCALSPENLTHDGELPQSVVVREERKLLKRLQQMFDMVGREVSEDEAFKYMRRIGR